MESQPPAPQPGLPKEENAGTLPVEKIETPDYMAELKAKDDRIDKQASRQSALITQRKNNLPTQNFESTEDSLDGFDLESFGPK